MIFLRSQHWDQLTKVFNALVRDMQSGIICTLGKFAENINFCDGVDTLVGRDGIQRDLDGLEGWVHVNLMKFNEAKCKVWHMGQGNPKQKYRLDREWTESSSTEERDLGLLVDEKLDTIRQCELSAEKVNHILECIKRSMAHRSRKVILPHCYALIRPHLGHCSWLFGLLHKKDTDLLE